ncbi:Rhamnogalacturonyl hydrolase YesR [Bryocella elongata]|uniref:Rhamnogalacturonyl hydrolase YesR n=1 Tax=Bryocella elongata TaxID=863522 RepID=A0A1H5UA76_9BACT|nr:glycoside hydrolase family 88 protein [Bryocella elongata]SEF71946.1 Rhamnogalacturonyl hydrolase YesR [Bryocella elongata]
MSQLTRRRFGQSLMSLPAALAAAPMFSSLDAPAAAQEAKPTGHIGGTSFDDWPQGYDPKVLGPAVARHFLATPHMKFQNKPTIIYPEVCTWWGALEVAKLTQDEDLLKTLVERFEPLFSTEASWLPEAGKHVDLSMFGSLPLELYMQTKDKRYLELGLKYADAQWAKPDAKGLTDETRFWIDDMWMITIVQLQAYRATGEKKYLDRAAVEMSAYLDKLQQPNGLFFHSPDVHFFWGRGNGWFAAGMAEMMRELPKSHSEYSRIEKGYRTMLASLLRYQGKDGMWRQLIDHEESWPESSCTGMFSYAMVTGVRTGLLDHAQYAAAARRAWIGMVGYVDQNLDVTNTCEGTNKFNDLDYYLLRKRKTGDFHGQAPLLWTAAAVIR